jgi:hypothetical protein
LPVGEQLYGAENMIQTDVSQFKVFHEYITKDHPDYSPFYFPLNKNGKDPLENKSWKKNKQTFEQASKYLEMGYNIGIAATDTDRLVIMDKDDLEKVGVTKPTLTTISRKRFGEHSFYVTDDKLAVDIYEDSAKQNIATEVAGEIRASWQYVVCAGSFVPVLMTELDDDGNKIWDKIPEEQKIHAGKYTIKETVPVNTISFSELPEVFRKCLVEKREDDLKRRLSPIKKEALDKNDKHKSALFSLTIETVTGKNENGSLRFPSLFHGSATGANSSIKDGMFHCWRHSVSHSPLTALAVIAGFGDCSKLGFAHHGRGTSGIDLADGETQFKLWEYAKKEGLIPHDDPIPTKGMVWYALKDKLCVESDIIDGWKLPTTIYNLTLQKLHEAGVIPGRQPCVPTINKNKGNNPAGNTCGICEYTPRAGGINCRHPDFRDKKGKPNHPTLTAKEACEKFMTPVIKIDEGTEAVSANLLKYVERDGVELFHDEVGTPYARIPINNRYVIMQIGGKQFKQWLGHENYSETHKVVRSDTISSAINVIEGKCCFEGKKYKLHNRVCWHEDAIWFDLGDWTAVRIRPEGWEIIENPPILFRRYSHQQPHDKSKIKKGGDITKIFKYLNISEEDDKDLFLTTLESFYIPDIPHAVLIPFGEQGSTKSTMFCIIKRLVDPSIIELATFPKDNAELMQQLDHHYFIGFDNVSGLSTWESDVMCRAATGMGFSKRVLYSDEDDLILKIKRCIGLNGINIVATKPDLLDRSVSIECQRISEDKRKTEGQFWNEFEQDKGEIVGAIFDVISKAMKYKVELSKLPRMADFALWGSALSYASGKTPGHFINAYFKNIEKQDREALENNVVGEMMSCFMDSIDKWEGTASALYNDLYILAENADMVRQFPSSPNALTRKINTLKTTLSKAGIKMERKVGDKNTTLFLSKNQTANEKTKDSNIRTGDIVCTITTISPEYHQPLNDPLASDTGGTGDTCDINPPLLTSNNIVCIEGKKERKRYIYIYVSVKVRKIPRVSPYHQYQ